jgi:hypothetical protein
MKSDHGRSGVDRQSGLDLAPAALQRGVGRLQFFRLDRAVQAQRLRVVSADRGL